MTDDFTLALWLHVIAACAALASGGLLLASRKGGRRHRALGYLYLSSMLVLLGAAAFMPATFMPMIGNFGFFHIFLVLGTASMLLGLSALWGWRRRRDPRALHAHQIHLAYSYAGLVMAGFSQMFTNPGFGLPWIETPAGFWTAFILLNAAIYAAAIYLIQTRVARADPLRFAGTASGNVVR